MAKRTKAQVHASPVGYYLDFGGAAEGDDVVTYLSDPDLPPDDQLKKWIALEEKLSWETIAVHPNARDTRDEIVRLLGEVFDRTGIGFRHVATQSGPYYDIKLEFSFKRPLSPADVKLFPPFRSALVLFSRGMLSRVRRCARKECAKLFFAKLAVQRFHSRECGSAVAAADPGRKQRRAKYMREHRRTLKVLAKKKKKGEK